MDAMRYLDVIQGKGTFFKKDISSEMREETIFTANQILSYINNHLKSISGLKEPRGFSWRQSTVRIFGLSTI